MSNPNNYNPYGTSYGPAFAGMPQQHVQQQQQQLVNAQQDAAGAMFVPLTDAWRQLEYNDDAQPQAEINANVAAPVRLDGTNSITILRELSFKCSPEQLMANPDLAQQTFAASVDFNDLRANGVKLVPKSIRLLEKQNGLPYAIGFKFNHPVSDRKTLKINANCMTSDKHENVDIVVREGLHAPMACDLNLFVTNEYSSVDLLPFQGMHRVSKEDLESGVIQRVESPNGNPSLAFGDVIKHSAVHRIALEHAAQYHLDGNNVMHLGGVRYDNFGNEYEVVRMPLHVINSSIEWGNHMIDELPFQDPEELVATMVRLDGKPFDELDNEQDRAMDAHSTRVPVGITIEEIYAPFYCTSDGRRAVAPGQ